MNAKPSNSEITVNLWECQHCGELSQTRESMQHLGCHVDHEFRKHPAAVIIQKEIMVQPVAYRA